MLRVLVVEDYEDSAAVLAKLLSLYGCAVELAVDGPSGLQAFQVSQPDLVILDIGLPKMDGWQVAKRIRKQSNAKRPFLIAMTGYGTQADRLRSREAGIDVHLVKPVDPVELEAILKRLTLHRDSVH
jgi:CheY-like chemotaxis protein